MERENVQTEAPGREPSALLCVVVGVSPGWWPRRRPAHNNNNNKLSQLPLPGGGALGMRPISLGPSN